MIGILGVHLALAVGTALTKIPWEDEAWFANPAVNLMTRSFMGTSVIQAPYGLGVKFEGLDRYTYWVMPLYLVTQAGWYTLVGFSLFSMRLLSIVWGLVALTAWWRVVKLLSGNANVALLALALIAVDSTFVSRAAEGRMDMMCAALGASGSATYLSLRERNLNLAVGVSHTLVALGALTHPNALLAWLGLVAITVYFDTSRLTWRQILLAALPYCVAALGWALYISQSPSLFLAQFSGNVGGRFSGLGAPLVAIKEEIVNRYLGSYGLGSHWAGPVVRLKLLILLAYVTGIACAIVTPGIRQHRGYRLLIILTLMGAIVLAIFDQAKPHVYLIHILPLFAALVAIASYWYGTQRGWRAGIAVASIAGLVALQIGAVAYAMARNPYHTWYSPAVAYLKAHRQQSPGLIMGTAEIGFALGFDDSLVDDITLGYYSKRRPEVIVVNDRYRTFIHATAATEPAMHRYLVETLTEGYRKAYENGQYTIYTIR